MPPAESHPPIVWHARSAADAVAALGAAPEGLSHEEAARRLARCGPNRVARAKPTPAFRILLDQLRSIVVWLLIAAAAISVAMDDLVEAAAIGAVLFLNTTLGFTIDLRARRAMDALLQLDISRCAVWRGGAVAIVDAAELVPGDVIDVERGGSIPADARLQTSHDLRTMEAALTGESLPVSKRADAILDADTPLAERRTMVYKGTTVVAGQARAIVVATAGETELGRIGALVASIGDAPTPLERRLDELGRRLVWLVLATAAAVAGVDLLHGAPLPLVVETAIALAVAAAPEALPAVVTIALAVGLRRMAARRALVRHLAAVEALGSVTVVCSDKTRTLTSGDMTLVRVWTADASFDLGAEPHPAPDALAAALEVAVLASRPRTVAASDASPADADPVDTALVEGAERAGFDVHAARAAHRAVAIVPFSSERRLMATFTWGHGGPLVANVKGAPGRILDLCSRVRHNGRDERLDDGERASFAEVNARLAAAGLRVLALATGVVGDAQESHLRNLTFIGFAGLMDPPAPGVRETIAQLRGAGLRTIMLTGDQRNTAHAIGVELGLLDAADAVVDGRELRGLDAEALRARVASAGAFSRIAPDDKLRVVESLQARGDVVAMLGDGVNDAAALKKADVGVAMGRRGTDVAKEAASIVLQDDRFETIAAAVEEGRVVYDNIRKFVFYLFSCNIAEVLVLAVAGLSGLPAPLLPLQILWLNLITDTFPALALALEPGDRDVMRRPPRDPREAILSRPFLGSIAFYGALITAASLAAFLWMLERAPERAATACFMTLGLAQIFHLGNARSNEPVLHPGRAIANPFALAAVALSAALQWLAVSWPWLAGTLRVTPLDATEWAVIGGLSIAPAVIGQIVKGRGVRPPSR